MTRRPSAARAVVARANAAHGRAGVPHEQEEHRA